MNLKSVVSVKPFLLQYKTTEIGKILVLLQEVQLPFIAFLSSCSSLPHLFGLVEHSCKHYRYLCDAHQVLQNDEGDLMLDKFEDVFYKQGVDTATGKPTFERVYINNKNNNEKSKA